MLANTNAMDENAPRRSKRLSNPADEQPQQRRPLRNVTNNVPAVSAKPGNGLVSHIHGDQVADNNALASIANDAVAEMDAQEEHQVHGVADVDMDSAPTVSVAVAPVEVKTAAPKVINIRTQAAYTQPDLSYDEDIYSTLRQKEIGTYRPMAEYMTRVQNDLTFTMRGTLIDWLVEVAQEYSLRRQTLYLTANYVDRYLSVKAVKRSRLQLVGVTAMWIASKYEELDPPTVDEFVYIADNTYTRDEMIAMEGDLLRVLDFNLTAPTPYEFQRRFTDAVQASSTCMHLTMYLIERFVQEPLYLRYLPSMVAVSAVSLALYTLGQPHWPEALQTRSGYTFAELSSCMQDMYNAFVAASQPQARLTAVFTKYSQPQFEGVSKIRPVTSNTTA